jgi:5-methylcytosine-specific restriction endonuclease McrA
MPYQVPKCDCGSELHYEKDMGITDVYQINKNGKKSKRRLRAVRNAEFIRDRLQCAICNNSYHIDGSIDDNFRIIRGELMS